VARVQSHCGRGPSPSRHSPVSSAWFMLVAFFSSCTVRFKALTLAGAPTVAGTTAHRAIKYRKAFQT
jgi:hypothetical protein